MKKVFTLVLSIVLSFTVMGTGVTAKEENGGSESNRSEYPILFCEVCGTQLYVFHTTPTHYWMRCPRGCMGDDWIEVPR